MALIRTKLFQLSAKLFGPLVNAAPLRIQCNVSAHCPTDEPNEKKSKIGHRLFLPFVGSLARDKYEVSFQITR